MKGINVDPCLARLPKSVPQSKKCCLLHSFPPSKMTSFTPYTYFQCPCTDTSISTRNLGDSPLTETEENSDDDRTFDPRAARSNYSLYPLEHLLYCEDCHQIRCPRCVLDEIVTWYCPNCLFEVPSSTVKSEGNR
jgi:dynactin 4